jgi:hypothetical protein
MKSAPSAGRQVMSLSVGFDGLAPAIFIGDAPSAVTFGSRQSAERNQAARFSMFTYLVLRCRLAFKVVGECACSSEQF